MTDHVGVDGLEGAAGPRLHQLAIDDHAGLGLEAAGKAVGSVGHWVSIS